MFYEWNGYKLRLDAMRIIQLEEKLGGRSPLSIFNGVNNQQMPALKDLLLVLHYSLQALNQGIKLEDTYKIYDEFVTSGKGLVDLIPVIIEVYKMCGLIPKEVDSKN